MRGARRPIVLAMASLIASTSVAIATAPTAYAAPNCAALNDAVQYRVNPTTSTGLLTSSRTAANKAAGVGYTQNRGVLFKAAIQRDRTLSVVHRLYKSSTKDYIFLTGAAEISKAKKSGYVNYGSTFSASKTAAACLVPGIPVSAQERPPVRSHHQCPLGADHSWLEAGRHLVLRRTGGPTPAHR
jgi:hypothetical protein